VAGVSSNQAGQLELKISLPWGDDLAAVGTASGEVHLLHSGPYGSAFDFIEESIFGLPNTMRASYSRDYYLNCPDDIAKLSSLQYGVDAYVIETEANIFANPRQTARVVQILPAGSTVSIALGPYCTGQMIWWKVYTDQTQGYILEFDGDRFYLK